MLAQAAPESDSDPESRSDDDDGPPEAEDLKGKRQEKVEKVEWSTKRRTDIAKRSSKHACVLLLSLFSSSYTIKHIDQWKLLLNDLSRGSGKLWKCPKSYVGVP